MMKRAIPLGVLAILLLRPAMAKDTRFWNLTSSTVKSLELAPAGASAFGPNQTTNDPDGAVDHDERLKVTGVKSGAYDARLKLADGRVCMAKGVQIEAGKVFTIDPVITKGISPQLRGRNEEPVNWDRFRDRRRQDRKNIAFGIVQLMPQPVVDQ